MKRNMTAGAHRESSSCMLFQPSCTLRGSFLLHDDNTMSLFELNDTKNYTMADLSKCLDPSNYRYLPISALVLSMHF